LELHNVNAEAVNYQARAAVRVKDAARADVDDAKRLAIIPGTLLQDGAIEIILSGDTTAEASAQARGFVGIAFRVSGDRTHFECFYLRPKNGRSEDQLQRNHSTQYISVPGFPWNKLRAESPGKYEPLGADCERSQECSEERTQEQANRRTATARLYGSRTLTAWL
jgi:hypothetical protein